MPGAVKINGKILSIQEAADRLNDMGLDVGEFSEATYIFSLEFPFDAAITIVDGYECSILGNSHAVIELEAV